MLNSDYARLRILDAAYDLFGKCGYAATTVRMIAGQADVSLSAIPYHFDNKDNLFQQVVQMATDEFALYFEQIIQDVDIFMQQEHQDLDVAKQLLFKLANRHMDYVFDPQNDKQMRLFFQLRSSYDPSGDVKTPIHMSTTKPFVQLLEILRPELSHDEVTILAYSIIGEQLFFFYHRPSVLAQLHLKEYTSHSQKQIRSVLMQRLKRELDGVGDN